MPQAPRGRSLHVRCTGLADVGGSNDRPRLYPVTRSHPEIRVELQQGRTRKMGDAHPELAQRKPRSTRLFRQRRRRRRPAKRSYVAGNVALIRPLNWSDNSDTSWPRFLSRTSIKVTSGRFLIVSVNGNDRAVTVERQGAPLSRASFTTSRKIG